MARLLAAPGPRPPALAGVALSRRFRPGRRFVIDTNHQGRPWIVIVEPDADEGHLVIVTVYEARR